MIEEWRWIAGYEGLYMISNFGRMKSFRKYDDGYILSNINSKGDYLRVNLYDRNRLRKSTSIHILVAKTFIGEIPQGYQVHHIDENKQNNAVSNLLIVHPRDHYYETLKSNPQIISGIVKYNKEKSKAINQYSLSGIFIARFSDVQSASMATGVCGRNILQVAAETPYNNKGNKRKQAGGYIWRFAEKER